MKFLCLAAAAATLLSSSSILPGGLVADALAVPAFRIVNPLELKVAVLGGLTFRINQVPNRRFSAVLRGPRALASAYSKFGAHVPDDLLLVLSDIFAELGIIHGVPNSSGFGRIGGAGGNVNRPANAGQGEVAAIPQMFDSEYLAEVQIGTPPQTLTLNFDTGSSDLWVFSTETPQTQVKGQKLYNPALSSTAQRLDGATWSIRYGDGSSSDGNVFLDTVSIGGVTVEAQAVESATNVSAAFSADAQRSGLLGLAFGSLNTVRPAQQRTFFENAVEELAMPLFTANLNKAEAGNYNFGFIDQTEFSGPLTFIDVNRTSGFWQFTASGYSVGSGPQVASPHVAIADTGTTLLLLPDGIVGAYYAQVASAQADPQAGGWTFACAEVLPDFTASVGPYQAVVPGELINFAPLSTGSARCFGGIQSSAALPFAIYGAIFFKAQFVVFHGGTNQLGFAPKPE